MLTAQWHDKQIVQIQIDNGVKNDERHHSALLHANDAFPFHIYVCNAPGVRSAISFNDENATHVPNEVQNNHCEIG